jgi:SDR family mycofactocin-dependent oxidoreductase
VAGRVAGKVAFITGGGHGQGRSHAVRLAEEGADIVLVDACKTINEAVTYPMSSPDELAYTAELVEKQGRRVLAREADVRNYGSLAAVVEEAMSEFGRIDILCGNAGIISYHWAWEIPEDAWDDVIGVNLKGAWNSVRAVVPHMMKDRKGGSIILTSSSAGIRGLPFMAHYVASKFGVVGLAKTLANELGQYNIRVNTIHPGAVVGSGDFVSAMGTQDKTPFELFSQYPEFAPGPGSLRDPNGPDDARYSTRAGQDTRNISEAVLWLASDESRFVTGIQVPVDDGQVNRQ